MKIKIKKEDEILYVPFWYVNTTSEEAKANMRYATIKTESGMTIPVLQNFRKVTAHERLLLFKAKEVRGALQGATVEQEAAPSSGAQPKPAVSTEGQNPKKRARK